MGIARSEFLQEVVNWISKSYYYNKLLNDCRWKPLAERKYVKNDCALVAGILQNFENQIEELKQKDEDERCEKYLKEGLISGQPVWWIRNNGTKTRANARSMGKKGVIIDICYEKEVQ